MATRCKWCSITFASAAQLNQHLEADIKTHQYYCQKCKFTVRSFRALKEHYNRSPLHDASDDTEMMTDSNSYCGYCRRQCETFESLILHFARTHQGELHCEACGLWFRFKSNLDQHLASPVHNEPNIPCPHCSEVFKTTSGVAQHLEYKCLKRTIEAVVKWDVDNQITNRIYTNRIQEVDSDDDNDTILVMRRSPQIQRIVEMLANEETWDTLTETYVCPVPECERQFKKLGHLNQHLRSQIHKTDPSTFRCPKCEKRFPIVSALIQHLESESCTPSGFQQVNQIYTGLYDMFKRLLTF